MLRLFLSLGLLLAVYSTAAWGVVLKAHEESLVYGPNITIGEVAEVLGADPKTLSRVRAIVIGQSPTAGEDRSLRGAYIVTRLKQYGFELDQWDLQIPETLRITRAFQNLDVRDIEAAVRREIEQQMPWEPEKTTIHEIRGIESAILPPGEVQYGIVFPARANFLGATSFSLSLRVDGKVEKRLHGTAYIETVQDVVMVVRPIAKHEMISEDDVRLKQMKFSQAPRQVVTRLESVIGKRAKRPLRAHTMLRQREIETQPLVQKGSIVRILAHSDQIKISAVGEALERGDRGETIRVRNTTSRREVRAIVVDSKTVKVPF